MHTFLYVFKMIDQLQLAHEALGEPSLEEAERGGYGMRKWKHMGLVLGLLSVVPPCTSGPSHIHQTLNCTLM